ncbi:lantibiotic dehydratase [Streptomyces sp. AM 4-1-1]|uniref:lantibiotic dehydratase n=1 Tax=Streptomyces sp. AM 4-1-1 TaxID=3028710 RepID=UPI0023B91BE3|nr:lantibiotic dehydratase [Streptomyces sp. AM 4-1-1]WEH31956.1 lantibiotic dehydratase [Streptomyces sp. AM 4-1-1]
MFQYLDGAVVRATAWPADHAIGSWPDLTGPGAGPESWRPWLREVLEVPGFAAALEQASPVLARRARDIGDGRPVAEPVARRAVLALLRYVLRASGRATPFGLFAGVAPARIAASPGLRAGDAHRAVARVEARWLTAVIERLENEPALRPRLAVLANNLILERDGQLVLVHRSSGSVGSPPVQVSVRATAPAIAVLKAARGPIRWADLVGKLAIDFPGVPGRVIDRLLGELVTQGFLLTSLRPAMTADEPLGHLLAALQTAGAQEIGEVAETVAWLRDIARELSEHDTAPTPAAGRDRRERLSAVMVSRCAPAESPLAVDLRLDWDLTVPHAVAAEAAEAADVLVRLAPRRNLNRGWAAWHERFLDRYGPRAVVPLLDAVDADTGLGYPAGYLGSSSVPEAGGLTDRDRKLLTLAQRAALAGRREIVLDDAMVADLAAVDAEMSHQRSTELTVRIHTPAEGLDEFALSIVGVSRSAGTTTGRFLSLFGDEDRTRMAALYANTPTANCGALRVQLSAGHPYAATENVARAPQVIPRLLPLGEFHDGGGADRIAVDDLAVTADVDRVYLVSLSRRRPVEPVVFNAVEPVLHTHPLARFVLEATSALSTPCAAFDWGAAAGLPFLPALRCGRTTLSPARWLLDAVDLPASVAPWQEWDSALTAWRTEAGLPAAVYLGDGDRRIGLDLGEPAHRALLRAHLDRKATAVLRATSGAPVGWMGGHVHEVVIPLAATGRPQPAPGWVDTAVQVSGREHGHLPGADGRFYVKLYGHPDRATAVLTRHLPRLLTGLGEQVAWWFVRYRDPQEHLRLRLTVPADRVAAAAAQIGAWTKELRRAGLVARVQWDTYFPETARFGGEEAMAAAESYFAADSAAALAQLTAGSAPGGPDPRALTAAGMLDAAVALFGDPGEAMRWLIAHARNAPSAPARPLYDQAVALANPYDQHHLAAQPAGADVAASWARRRQALAAYRRVLDRGRAGHAADLLPELLHLHHVRMAGISSDGERTCLHLARAAALSWSARATKGA